MSDDLERVVREALATAWRDAPTDGWEGWRGAFVLDAVVPAVVRLVEAQRAPLIAEMRAAGRPFSDEYQRGYSVGVTIGEGKSGETHRQHADLLRTRAEQAEAAHASALRDREAVEAEMDRRLGEANAAVVEARKAALLEGADALEEFDDDQFRVAGWLRARADAQGSTPPSDAADTGRLRNLFLAAALDDAPDQVADLPETPAAGVNADGPPAMVGHDDPEGAVASAPGGPSPTSTGSGTHGPEGES